MRRFIFCVSLAFSAGLMTSCVDKYEEVDADSKPEWLGSSIYSELENPSAASGLQGTFKTYLRLISDLGQADVLSKTGSKTVFPANDSAFARFFAKNDWGVGSYEQLTYSQKVLLLKSSMLDNPLLLQMLPNVSNGTVEPTAGQAIKHATNVQVIDSVQYLVGKENFPQNKFGKWDSWSTFYDSISSGVRTVSDATRPMMVHLTREYMLNNDITITGDESDFAIITGMAYPEGSRTGYIFNDRVIVPDVTCQNGYIHQMEDVVVPPGNMAQVLRQKDNTKFISHILDYYSVPIYSKKVTDDYNAWARSNNQPESDIYQWRYLSKRSYDADEGGVVTLDRANGKVFSSSTEILKFDPGWNQYYPEVVQTGGRDVSIMDMAAFFVPSDQAVKDYFLEGGHGAYLIDIYGKHTGSANNEANLMENLDSLHNKRPEILTSFLNNLMQASFTASVPSKFDNVLNDASENLGLSVGLIERNGSKYDVTIANNGAIYVLKELIAPDEYQAVLAPSSTYADMHIMNWAVQDRGSTGYHLGLDYKFYLLAMKANYAFFIPQDSAFNYHYLDPATLGHRAGNSINGKLQPDVLHFWYSDNVKDDPRLKCERYAFDLETGERVGEPVAVPIADVKTQLQDLLNYHTLVLNEGQVLSATGNKFYKTKHGGEVKIDFTGNDKFTVASGVQIDKACYDEQKDQLITIPAQSIAAPTMLEDYPEKNGHAYRLDRVIQPPTQSVYSVLKTNSQFSDFLALCIGFSSSDVLDWAGISNQEKETGGTDQDAYVVFTSDYKIGKTVTANACLDYNVKMFNTYNYTLFAPDNTAMATAYQNGLPRWTSDDESEVTVSKLYQEYVEKVEQSEDPANYVDDAEDIANKAKALSMIKAMRDFVRFHFMTTSVYIDKSIDGGRYKTLSSDDLGVAKEIVLSGSNNELQISDREKTHTVTVKVSGNPVANKMTRDYWFNARKTAASSIVTSSFCAVHQLSEPLCADKNGRFDNRVVK